MMGGPDCGAVLLGAEGGPIAGAGVLRALRTQDEDDCFGFATLYDVNGADTLADPIARIGNPAV